MHTQTSTVTQSSINVNTAIRYDPLYLRTIPGILKSVCVILNLLGFISVQCSNWSHLWRASFFNTVSMVGFWFTGIMLVFYIFHVIEKFFRIPFILVELVFCGTITFFYLVASFFLAVYGSMAFSFAAFFGFCAMVAYGYDCFIKYQGWKVGEIAQVQSQSVQQQQTIIQTPASAFPA